MNRTQYSLNDKLADYFRRHAGEWLTMEQLAAVAGTGGWRTRVADLVKPAHLGGRYEMQIERRARQVFISERGKFVTVFDRRYVPQSKTTPPSGHDLNLPADGRLI